MALTFDQKKQVLEKAKQSNPGLTRDQATALLQQADGLIATQSPQAPKSRDVSKYIVPEGSTEPNKAMSVLANVQQSLGKEGKLSAAIPVASGVIGSMLGGIGGAAAGAGVGERLQQLLDPSKAIGGGGEAGQALQSGNIVGGVLGNQEDRGNIAKEAATSATLDFLTGGLGKFASPVMSGVKNAVGKEALEKGFQEAFSIPRALSASIKFPQATKELIEYGIGGKSMQEFGEIAAKVTGQDGVLPQAVRQALGTVDNVTIDMADDAVLKIINQAKRQATNVSKPVLENSEKEIMATLALGDEVGFKTKPLEVFDAIQSLERKGNALLSQTNKSLTDSASNVALEQQSRLYLDAAEALKDKLFSNNTVGKDIIDSLKTPERIAALQEVSPKLAEKFAKATNLSELRTLQAPFVSLSKAVNSTLEASTSPFANLSSSLTGQGRGSVLDITGVPQLMGAVKGALESPQARTGMALIPQKVSSATQPQNVLSSLKGLVTAQSPTVGGVSKEALLQLLRSQMN